MLFAAFRHAWKDLSRFKSMDHEQRSIVFYAQDIWAWKHFKPIVDTLVETLGRRVSYVTSNREDPVLQIENSRIQTFYIGLGAFRTSWFQSLEAKVLVMTMPDFGTYHIRRSKHLVHYIYLHHSMVSSHMAYRPNAFDNFDSILCVGPHHRTETRAFEELKNLHPKSLLNAGYGVLDQILASKCAMADDLPEPNQRTKRVLVAPSWGDYGLLETKGTELVEVLLKAGFLVTVRPHYMTIRNHPKLLGELQKEFGHDPNFLLDTELESQGTVHSGDIMISDWSGAALEFAFGLERPVLFIDTPKKVNNPHYADIGLEPIEIWVRSQIGEVVSPEQLSDIPAAVNRLCENPGTWRETIFNARSNLIYNVGKSASVSAHYIAKIADEFSSRVRA